MATAGDSLKSDDALNDHITMYVDDVLVWGTEPDGTTPSNYEPTTAPTSESTTQPNTNGDVTWGDANDDGTVSVADPTLIMQAAANPNEFTVTNAKAADVSGGGDGVTSADALVIQCFLAGSIDALPAK